MNFYFKNYINRFLVISLSIHLLLFVSLYFHPEKPPDISHQNLLEVEFLTVESSEDRPTMQLIEQEEQQWNEEVPEDTKYLGRHNQKVAKETRASQHGDYRNAPGSGGIESGFQEKEKPIEKQTQAETSAVGSLPTLSDLRPQYNLAERHRTQEHLKERGGPGSQTNDHLPDVKPSIETLLNSREFVYYTYYQRIRSQLRQHWEPSIREKIRKIFAEGRSIASTQNHTTKVIIVLSPEGSLLGVQVVGESGISDLDEAAVEAFRAAEPFPNPPKDIVDADGTIKIRWDFVLETSASITSKEPLTYAGL